MLLCGAATAAAGPIAFVGLTVPHVARPITGPDYRWILPYSMVLGPVLLLGADIIGRVVARPGEVQVGIVTALIGAPVLHRPRPPPEGDRRPVDGDTRLPAASPAAPPSGGPTVVAGTVVGHARPRRSPSSPPFCVSISVGDFPIPLRDVVPAIFGYGDEDADFIVRTLRLPRALTGLLVGVAFGLSGAIFQSLARNPLASPDIIGITRARARRRSS